MLSKLEHRAVQVCLASASVLALGVLAAGCAGEDTSRTVNASVALDLPDAIPAGSPFDVGYRWTPGEDFEPPADDYRVFVHFVDPDGNIVAQDDHFPTPPTSQWRAGEAVEYRRWVYPDPLLRIDYFDFYVGLHDEQGQVATMRDDRFQQRPLVHTVEVETDNQRGMPVFMEGFADRETSLTGDDSGTKRWQWMRGRGVVAFGNPRGPSVLHLRARSPVDELGKPQTVTIRRGDVEIARFEIDNSSPYLMRFDVPGDGLGDSDWVDFIVEVDGTFVPAQASVGSDDTRELGLQVFWMYLAR